MQAAGIQLHDHLLALLHHWLLLAFSAEAFPKPFHFVKNSLKNFNSVKLYSTGVRDEKISCFSRTHIQLPDPNRCTFRMT